MPFRLAGFVAVALVSGCLVATPDAPELTWGTVTSVRDSGLVDAIVAAYAVQTGVNVRAIVGGTGEVLEYARRGDVDVVLTHSPAREATSLVAGEALLRRPIMESRFLVVGPPSDPARVADADGAADAMARIAASRAMFASRGDGSGTHDRELVLWTAASLDPRAFDHSWYKEVGGGQAAALRYANERGAYALTDEPTFLRLSHAGATRHLVTLHSGGEALRNEYAVLVVNATRHRGMDGERAGAFADWLAGPHGQAIIEAYEVDGARPFHPIGGRE